MTHVVTRLRPTRVSTHQRTGHRLGLLLGLLLGALVASGCGDDASSSGVPDAASPDDAAASMDAPPAIDGAPAPDADPQAPDGGSGQSCGGFVGDICGDRSYCDFPDDSCGIDNGLGTCKPRPELCSPGGESLCGCDSRQYQSECEAYRAGTDVSTSTDCEPGSVR